MPATLTPFARHARLHQSMQPLPWTRTGTGLHQPQEAVEPAVDQPIDAAAVREAWLTSQYATGFGDGFVDGLDVGERQGTVRGWYWGAACGCFATALLAIVAGFVLAAWGSAPQAEAGKGRPAAGSLTTVSSSR